jgi:glycosyltransferase involved in cell wall biosynthesis
MNCLLPIGSQLGKQTCFLLCTCASDNLTFLKESIESLNAQTLTGATLFIGVDGQVSEHTKTYLDSLTQEGGSTVVIYSSENLGLAYMLNQLILHALRLGYDYLVRMDADDYSHPQRLEYLLSFLHSNPSCDCVGSAFQTFGPIRSTTRILPSSNLYIKQKFSYGLAIAHATVCFRRSFFYKAGLYSPCLPERIEDLRLWAAAFRADVIFSNVPNVLYYVRSDRDQILRRTTPSLAISVFFLRLNHIFISKLSCYYVLFALIELILRVSLYLILYPASLARIFTLNKVHAQ